MIKLIMHNKIYFLINYSIGGVTLKKYEYKWIDLRMPWSMDSNKQMNDFIDKLNKLGQEGWILVSGVEVAKYAVVMREILSEDK